MATLKSDDEPNEPLADTRPATWKSATGRPAVTFEQAVENYWKVLAPEIVRLALDGKFVEAETQVARATERPSRHQEPTMSMTIPDMDRLLSISDDFIKGNRAVTGAELLEHLHSIRDAMLASLTETQTHCKNCQRPVVRAGSRWMHLAPSLIELSNRGCRAASYAWLGTYDEILPQGVQATPSTAPHAGSGSRLTRQDESGCGLET